MERDEGLPGSGRVDVSVLARLFADTATSYKYFFFLALLDRIQRAGTVEGIALDRPIPLDGLAVDMVLGAWFPHGFCRLSLGTRDMLQKAVDSVDWGHVRGSWIVAGGEEWRRLRGCCAASLDTDSLMRFVPYRLIRPFFAHETRGLPDHEVNQAVTRLADDLFQERKPLYCLTSDQKGIILHHDWIEYLDRNVPILRGWARFQLAEYLQARNPSAAGIVQKLEVPIVRAPLTRQTKWWKEAISFLGPRARCIYSGETLSVDDFSLDHYLPWSFVVHDRLWNLVPVARSVNSAKNDRLPHDEHLRRLAILQSAAIAELVKAWPRARVVVSVEDFLVDLGLEMEELQQENELRSALERTVFPLEAIAMKQGFEPGWKISP